MTTKAHPDNACLHTPGPWTVRHFWNVFGQRRDVAHEGIVATCGGHSSNRVDCGPESEANARLIAAAPELLLMLKLTLADRQCSQMSDGPHADCLCWYCQASAVVAKAEKGYRRG